MPDVRADGDQWSLLVPVKRLESAKTRLALPAPERADIALAMACDTVSAGLACDAVAEVVVITSDPRAHHALSALGARVIDDRPDTGLNPALSHGALSATLPHVAALSSDLPALRPADLGDVLELALATPLAMVADISGLGTTLLAARAVGDFSPRFGVGSRAAHVSAGAIDLSSSAAASIRHDVDTVEALRAAVELGVGAATERALAASVELRTATYGS
jgi:2-phospho-L-lactate/phosphoenolpyruvate guanylyltransferase